MKKNNKEGFILVEAIVVAVFVLSLFTFLFVNIIPLIGLYEAQENYDTVDSVYNTNLIRSMIMGDAKRNDILTLKNASGNEILYKVYTPATLCTSSNIEKVKYCQKLLGPDYLNVKKIYITWYRTTKAVSSKSLKSEARTNKTDFDRATREYIASLDDFSKPSGATYNQYKRIIVSYNDGSFANLEIKIKES